MNGSFSEGRYPSGRTMLLARGDVRLAGDLDATFTSLSLFPRPLAAAALARPFTAAFLVGRLCLDFPMRFPECWLSLALTLNPAQIWCPYLSCCFFKSRRR